MCEGAPDIFENNNTYENNKNVHDFQFTGAQVLHQDLNKTGR